MERDIIVAKAVINFYNHRTLCSISPNAKGNQEFVFTALEKANGDIATLKEHVKSWLDNNSIDDFDSDEERFKACFTEFTMPQGKKEDLNVANSLAIIGNAVADALKATTIDKIEKDIMGSVQTEVRNFIKNEYGSIERKVTVLVDGVPRPTTGFIHEKFDTVLKFVANNEPVFLTGPAGSGKNVICKQVADALGLKFYFSNAVTQEYKLTGFTDAMGNYQPTQFYKAFTEGGLFMLDEMDASIPEVLVILNAAIANRYFDFPAPIGYVEAHPNFRVVAAGNTTGHGASYEYVGRNQLDAASLDRFARVQVDYSVEIENGIAEDNALADFCRSFRKASQKVGVSIIVSYRAIGRLAKMMKVLTLEEALKTCLIKDLEKDDINLISRELCSSPYKTALTTICEKM